MICLEKFKHFIGKIEDNDRKLSEIAELLGSVEKLCELSHIDESIQMLEMLCEDDSEMISYWAWELDFGRKWHVGCVTDADGNDIKLETVEDLYNYLAEGKQEGNQ